MRPWPAGFLRPFGGGKLPRRREGCSGFPDLNLKLKPQFSGACAQGYVLRRRVWGRGAPGLRVLARGFRSFSFCARSLRRRGKPGGGFAVRCPGRGASEVCPLDCAMCGAWLSLAQGVGERFRIYFLMFYNLQRNAGQMPARFARGGKTDSLAQFRARRNNVRFGILHRVLQNAQRCGRDAGFCKQFWAILPFQWLACIKMLRKKTGGRIDLRPRVRLRGAEAGSPLGERKRGACFWRIPRRVLRRHVPHRMRH